MMHLSTLRHSAACAAVAAPLLIGETSLAAQDDAARDAKILVAQIQVAAKKSQPKADAQKKDAKPLQIGTYGDWGAYVAQSGKDKTCYALSTPKDRAPSQLKRDPAYIFIATRPAEKVRNEVSIIMGFPLKESGATADISGKIFNLIARGSNAWIKNPAEEPDFVEAMKKGATLTIHAPSARGNVTTDTYSLTGVTQALEEAQKECS
jgi:hypothetical protein